MKIAEIHDLLDEKNLVMDERHLYDRVKVLIEKIEKISPWLSAALDDTKVCKEMKRDIKFFFGAEL